MLRLPAPSVRLHVCAGLERYPSYTAIISMVRGVPSCLHMLAMRATFPIIAVRVGALLVASGSLGWLVV